MREQRWFSRRKSKAVRFFTLGVGIGFHKRGFPLVLIFLIGRWIFYIGPHTIEPMEKENT